MKRLGDYSLDYVELRKVKNKRINGFVSIVLSLFVILMFVFAGPAQALIVNLDGLENTPYPFGENINFQGSIEVESGEVLNIQNITLLINGVVACTMDSSGNPLTACEGINAHILQNTTHYGYWQGFNLFHNLGEGVFEGYGYGYGYEGNYFGLNHGQIVYDVNVDSTHPYLFLSGGNKLKIIVHTQNQDLESNEGIVAVMPVPGGNGQFQMATKDYGLVLQGFYNSKEHTVGGFLYQNGSQTPYWAAAGTYIPHYRDGVKDGNSNSGEITFRIYNILVAEDAGLVWTGDYGNGIWHLHPEGNDSQVLSGIMISTPQ